MAGQSCRIGFNLIDVPREKNNEQQHHSPRLSALLEDSAILPDSSLDGPLRSKSRNTTDIDNVLQLINDVYFCGQCKLQIVTEADFRNHVNTHTYHTLYRCFYCPTLAWNITTIHAHIGKHHQGKEERFGCMTLPTTTDIIHSLHRNHNFRPQYRTSNGRNCFQQDLTEDLTPTPTHTEHAESSQSSKTGNIRPIIVTKTSQSTRQSMNPKEPRDVRPTSNQLEQPQGKEKQPINQSTNTEINKPLTGLSSTQQTNQANKAVVAQSQTNQSITPGNDSQQTSPSHDVRPTSNQLHQPQVQEKQPNNQSMDTQINKPLTGLSGTQQTNQANKVVVGKSQINTPIAPGNDSQQTSLSDNLRDSEPQPIQEVGMGDNTAIQISESDDSDIEITGESQISVQKETSPPQTSVKLPIPASEKLPSQEKTPPPQTSLKLAMSPFEEIAEANKKNPYNTRMQCVYEAGMYICKSCGTTLSSSVMFSHHIYDHLHSSRIRGHSCPFCTIEQYNPSDPMSCTLVVQFLDILQKQKHATSMSEMPGKGGAVEEMLSSSQHPMVITEQNTTSVSAQSVIVPVTSHVITIQPINDALSPPVMVSKAMLTPLTTTSLAPTKVRDCSARPVIVGPSSVSHQEIIKYPSKSATPQKNPCPSDGVKIVTENSISNNHLYRPIVIEPIPEPDSKIMHPIDNNEAVVISSDSESEEIQATHSKSSSTPQQTTIIPHSKIKLEKSDTVAESVMVEIKKKPLVRCYHDGDQFVCDRCKYSVHHSKPKVFRKHLWFELHRDGNCNHNPGGAQYNRFKACPIMQQLMVRLLDAKAKKILEQEVDKKQESSHPKTPDAIPLRRTSSADVLVAQESSNNNGKSSPSDNSMESASLPTFNIGNLTSTTDVHKENAPVSGLRIDDAALTFPSPRNEKTPDLVHSRPLTPVPVSSTETIDPAFSRDNGDERTRDTSPFQVQVPNTEPISSHAHDRTTTLVSTFSKATTTVSASKNATAPILPCLTKPTSYFPPYISKTVPNSVSNRDTLPSLAFSREATHITAVSRTTCSIDTTTKDMHPSVSNEGNIITASIEDSHNTLTICPINSDSAQAAVSYGSSSPCISESATTSEGYLGKSSLFTTVEENNSVSPLNSDVGSPINHTQPAAVNPSILCQTNLATKKIAANASDPSSNEESISSGEHTGHAVESMFLISNVRQVHDTEGTKVGPATKEAVAIAPITSSYEDELVSGGQTENEIGTPSALSSDSIESSAPELHQDTHKGADVAQTSNMQNQTKQVAKPSIQSGPQQMAFPQVYVCSFFKCSFWKANDAASFIEHNHTHHPDVLNLPCAFCSKKFGNSDFLILHINIKHSDTPKIIHFKPYNCGFKDCSLACDVARDFLCHNHAKHTRARLYPCCFCSHGFRTLAELVMHIDDSVTYSCTVCAAIRPTYEDIKKHIESELISHTIESGSVESMFQIYLTCVLSKENGKIKYKSVTRFVHPMTPGGIPQVLKSSGLQNALEPNDISPPSTSIPQEIFKCTNCHLITSNETSFEGHVLQCMEKNGPIARTSLSSSGRSLTALKHVSELKITTIASKAIETEMSDGRTAEIPIETNSSITIQNNQDRPEENINDSTTPAPAHGMDATPIAGPNETTLAPAPAPNEDAVPGSTCITETTLATSPSMTTLSVPGLTQVTCPISTTPPVTPITPETEPSKIIPPIPSIIPDEGPSSKIPVPTVTCPSGTAEVSIPTPSLGVVNKSKETRTESMNHDKSNYENEGNQEVDTRVDVPDSKKRRKTQHCERQWEGDDMTFSEGLAPSFVPTTANVQWKGWKVLEVINDDSCNESGSLPDLEDALPYSQSSSPHASPKPPIKGVLQSLGNGPTNPCDNCSFSTQFKAVEAIHKRLHMHDQDKDKMLWCPYCPYSTGTVLHFKIHIHGHTESTRIRLYHCGHCPFASNQMDCVEDHHEAVHPDLELKSEVTRLLVADLQCPDCSAIVKSEQELLEHMEELHSTSTIHKYLDEMYGIASLDVSVENKCVTESVPSMTVEHKWSIPPTILDQVNVDAKLSLDRFECPNCEYNYYKFDTWVQHLKQHQIPSSQQILLYSCKACDWKSTSKQKAIDHCKLKHAEIRIEAQLMEFSEIIAQVASTAQAAATQEDLSDKDVPSPFEHNFSNIIGSQIDALVKDWTTPEQPTSASIYANVAESRNLDVTKDSHYGRDKLRLLDEMIVKLKEEPNIQKAKGEKLKQCPICPYSHTTKIFAHLVLHRKLAFLERGLKCGYCPYVYKPKLRGIMLKHLKGCHPGLPVKIGTFERYGRETSNNLDEPIMAPNSTDPAYNLRRVDVPSEIYLGPETEEHYESMNKGQVNKSGMPVHKISSAVRNPDDRNPTEYNEETIGLIDDTILNYKSVKLKSNVPIFCPVCPVTPRSKNIFQHMRGHLVQARIKNGYKCPYCVFTCEKGYPVTRHINAYHRGLPIKHISVGNAVQLRPYQGADDPSVDLRDGAGYAETSPQQFPNMADHINQFDDSTPLVDYSNQFSDMKTPASYLNQPYGMASSDDQIEGMPMLTISAIVGSDGSQATVDGHSSYQHIMDAQECLKSENEITKPSVSISDAHEYLKPENQILQPTVSTYDGLSQSVEERCQVLFCTKVDEKDLFRCKLCVFMDGDTAKVYNHFITRHRDHCQFQCAHCDFRSVAAVKIQQHAMINHSSLDVKVILLQLDNAPENEAMTNQDMRNISPNNSEECENLQDEAYERAINSKLAHYIMTFGNKIHMCSICGVESKKQQALVSHILGVHLKFHPFSCRHCSYSAISCSKIRKHCEQVHPLLVVDVIRKEIPESLDVVHSNNAIDRANELSHCDSVAEKEFDEMLDTHAEENRDTPEPSSAHRKTTLSQKVYRCNLCNYVSKWFLNDVQNHIVSHHLLLYMFNCRYCLSGYIRRRELVCHYDTSHPGLPECSLEDRGLILSALSIVQEGNNVFVGLKESQVDVIKQRYHEHPKPQTKRMRLSNKAGLQSFTTSTIQPSLSNKPQSVAGTRPVDNTLTEPPSVPLDLTTPPGTIAVVSPQGPQSMTNPTKQHCEKKEKMKTLTLYECTSCKIRHAQKIKAQYHYAIKHLGMEPYHCQYCSFGARRRKIVIKHITDNHPDKSTTVFPTYQEHPLTQNKIRQIRIKVREFNGNADKYERQAAQQSSSESGLACQEVSSGQPILPITIACPVCNAQVNSLEALDNHLITSHPTYSGFQCCHCREYIANKSKMQTHLKNLHPTIRLKKYLRIKDGEPFGNPIKFLMRKQKGLDKIGFANITKSRLNARHSHAHKEPAFGTDELTGPQSPVSLLANTDGIVDIEKLKLHQIISKMRVQHRATGKKLLLCCTQCNFTTMLTQNIKTHVMTHLGYKPSTCPACTFCTIRRKTVVQHMLALHPDIPPVPKIIIDPKQERLMKNKIHIKIQHGDGSPILNPASSSTGNTTEESARKTEDQGDLPSKKKVEETSVKAKVFEKEGDMYVCILCRQPKFDRLSMLHHLMEENNYYPWHCPHCEYISVSLQDVQEHCSFSHPLQKFTIILKEEKEQVDRIHNLLQQSTLSLPERPGTNVEEMGITKIGASQMQHTTNAQLEPTYNIDQGIDPQRPVSSEISSVIGEFEARKQQLNKDLTVYRCKHCPYTTHSKAAIQGHKVRHGPKRVKCSYCDRTAFYKAEILQHQRRSHRQYPQSVIQLPRFRSKPSAAPALLAGVKRKHSMGTKAPDHSVAKDLVGVLDGVELTVDHIKVIPTGGYQCQFCEKTYMRSQWKTAKRHVIRGHFPKQLKCDYCSKAFNLPSDIKSHIRLTHPAMPMKYTNLDLQDSVVKQNRWHRSERSDSLSTNSVLPTMGIAGQQSSDDVFGLMDGVTLTGSHLKKTTNGEFQCQLCDACYSTSERKGAKRHVLSVHYPWRWHCDYCSKTYGLSSAIKVHIRRVHPTRLLKFTAGKAPVPYVQNSRVDQPEWTDSPDSSSPRNTDSIGSQLPVAEDVFGVVEEMLITDAHLQTLPSGQIQCRDCDQMYEESQRETAKYHVARIHFSPKWKCGHCSQTMPLACDLRQHVQNNHAGLPIRMLRLNTEERGNALLTKCDAPRNPNTPGPVCSKSASAHNPSPVCSKPATLKRKLDSPYSKLAMLQNKPGPACSKPKLHNKPGPACSKPSPSHSRPGPMYSKNKPAIHSKKPGPACSKKQRLNAATRDGSSSIPSIFCCCRCSFKTNNTFELITHTKQQHADSRQHVAEVEPVMPTLYPEVMPNLLPKVIELTPPDSSDSGSITETGESYQQPPTLSRHKEHLVIPPHHKDSQPLSLQECVTPSLHECQYCAFSSSDLCEFELHKLEHQEKRPYQCGDCEFSAYSRAAVQKHYTYHHKDKPVQVIKQAMLPIVAGHLSLVRKNRSGLSPGRQSILSPGRKSGHSPGRAIDYDKLLSTINVKAPLSVVIDDIRTLSKVNLENVLRENNVKSAQF